MSRKGGLLRAARKNARLVRRLCAACLALLLLTGLSAAEPGGGTAEAWRRAALRGDQRAQFELANLHLSGQWGAQDEARGIYWLQRSAEQGFAPAVRLLVHLYCRGTGLRPPDPARGTLWAARFVNSGRALEATGPTPPEAPAGGGTRVRLSEEEIQLLQVLRDPAKEIGAGGVASGPDRERVLLRRRELAQRLNSGLTRQSRWVVDPHSGCLVWFQELRGDEFICWDGGCDSEGFATGRGTLSFRSQENGGTMRCSGVMNAGIIVEGEFRDGE